MRKPAPVPSRARAHRVIARRIIARAQITGPINDPERRRVVTPNDFIHFALSKMNLFPTTTTSPVRDYARACSRARMQIRIAHGPRRGRNEKRDISTIRGPIMSGTHRLRSRLSLRAGP